MNEEMMTKEQVIELLRNMQEETCRTQGFFAGHVTQLWVVRDLLGKKIEELGGKSIEIKMQ